MSTEPSAFGAEQNRTLLWPRANSNEFELRPNLMNAGSESGKLMTTSPHGGIIEQTPDSPSSQEQQNNRLSRGLKERHVNMLAFSLLIGTGLFLQNGRVIFLAGPGVATCIYLTVALTIWAVVGALGEMTSLFPVPGAIFELPVRFLDPSIGYAAGWMAWFSWVVTFAAELDAASLLFQFEFEEKYLDCVKYPRQSLLWETKHDSPAIWNSVFLPLSVLVNLLPVRLYGEVEYCIGVLKMIGIVVLILLQLTINLEQGWSDRYYRQPWGFVTQNWYPHSSGEQQPFENLVWPNCIVNSTYIVPNTGNKAQFKGVVTGFMVAIFSLIGFESISIAAAEFEEFDKYHRYASNEGLKISTRKVAIRILLLYTLSTFLVGLNVPNNDPNLVDSNVQVLDGAPHSAFVTAAVRAQMIGWPHAMTAFFIFSAVSASINSFYLSSRLLHALALSGPVWPEYRWAKKIRTRLAQVTRNGVPKNAVLASSTFGLLGYLACKSGEDAPGQALGNLAVNATMSMLIVYIVICATFIRFKSQLRQRHGSSQTRERVNSQGNIGDLDRDNRKTYPYRSTAQPLRVIVAGVIFTIVLMFNGWRSFDPFQGDSFFASYTSIAVFSGLCFAYRFRARSEPDRGFWRMSPSDNMERPTQVERGDEEPARGELNLDIDPFWSTKNLKTFVKWVWVWLK